MLNTGGILMDREWTMLITANLITIRRISELAGEKGGLIFDVIKKIAEETLSYIEDYKEEQK